MCGFVCPFHEVLLISFASVQAKLSADAEKAVRAAFTGEQTVENLYYAISAMAYTGKKSEWVSA